MMNFGRRGRATSICLLALALASAAFLPTFAAASDDPFSLDVWQKEGGLPSDTVVSLAQTPDGFLWVGTWEGLARFDGVRFVPTRDPKELAGQRIERLFTDRSGALWVSTGKGALWRQSGGRFKSFGPESGWTDAVTRSFAEDRDGALLLVTVHGGAFQFRDGRFHRLLPDVQEKDATFEVVGDVWGDQTVWLRRGLAVGYFQGTNWTQVSRAQTQPARLAAMTPRRSGGVWLFSAEFSLDVLRDRRWPVESRVYPQFMDPHRLIEDAAGNIWIGTTRQGLVRVPKNEPEVRYFTGTGFPTDQINCLFEDREGNVWVGGSSGGLARFSRKTFSTPVLDAGGPPTSPLCLVEDGAGAMWVSYAEAGLHRFDNGRVSGPLALDGRAPQRSGWALLTGRDGWNWFAAYAIGLYAVRGSECKLWTTSEGLPSNDIRALAEDATGGLWIGGVFGLARFDGKSFVNVTQRDGLPKSEVHALTVDRAGNVWAGTAGSGLVRWRDGKAQVFSTRHGLPSNVIRSLLAEDDGSLWIGTADGLAWRRGKKMIAIDQRVGLGNADIAGVVDDARGNLWLTTSHGVLRISRAELDAVADGKLGRLTVRSFGREDGLPSLRASRGQPSAVRAHDGRLWFATLKGLAVVDPRDVRSNAIPPQAFIEQALLDGVTVSPRNSASLAGEHLQRADEPRLRVPPGTRRLEFRYTAPNLTAPERVHFQRRVEGLDDDWQDVGMERAVVYHSLRAGDYRLRVRAANADDVWSAEEASLGFTVAPWFWETTWFRGGLALTGVAAVGLTVMLRMRVLERRNAAREQFARQLMEQQESERKRIAAELHDSLGQSLSIIQNRAVLAANEGDAGPKSGAHVAGISQAATDALTGVREICQGLRPVELDRLGLSKTLAAVTERLAMSSPLKVVAEVDPVDALVAKEDWIHLLRFVQEALNNVVKHARATEATVTLREDDDCLRLAITDNGAGFEPRTKPRGHSLGLVTMEERARILGGELQFDSMPGRGTTVRLNVPKK